MPIRLLVTLTLLLSGCTVVAIKGDEKLELRGWGAKSAEFSDGSKIAKDEPIQVPDKIGVVND